MIAAHIHEPGALPTCPDCHYGSATQRDDGRCADCGEAHDAEVALCDEASDPEVAAWWQGRTDDAIEAQEAALDRAEREGRVAWGDAAGVGL